MNLFKKIVKVAKKKKQKYKSRKSKGGVEIKKIITIGSWLAILLLLLFFVGRYILKNSMYEKPIEDLAGINLCEVKLAEIYPEEVYNYTGFRVYFNSKYHIPNCVSYELTRTEIKGKVPRYKNFDVDPNFAESANPRDYTNSGYDRGHMAPAADMKWSRDAMRESFYMSNVCPQNKSLNTGAWHKLENKVREWATRDSAIIVVCGPIFSDKIERIGDNGVAVPKAFFKVLFAPNVAHPRAIAFIYNNEKCKGEMKKYAVTVDSVESLTGYDFFVSAPDDIENKVESVCNFNEWNQR